MFVFQNTWWGWFSCYLRFQICPFALLQTNSVLQFISYTPLTSYMDLFEILLFYISSFNNSNLNFVKYLPLFIYFHPLHGCYMVNFVEIASLSLDIKNCLLLQFRLESYHEPQSEIGFVIPAKFLVGIEQTSNFRYNTYGDTLP